MYIFKFISIFFSVILLADDNSNYPSSHAPIGVMGDHMHNEGEIMLSYRYSYMDMEGNRNNTNNLSNQDVLNSYMVTPTDMEMHMHMFGAMYAPTDNTTLMLMLPYVEKSMNHLTRMGGNFSTKTEGIGDINLSALLRLLKTENHHLHFNAGISFPTGEIDKKGDTPMGNNVQLPYPMQLGSGTYNLLPGLTYKAKYNNYTFGSQILGTIRLDENSNDYTLGNSYKTTIWASYDFNDHFSLSTRLLWESISNIDGSDASLNPMIIPTADPNLRGKDQLDIGIGFNLLFGSYRLATEVLFPVYQNLEGPQLETDIKWITGIQYNL